MPPFFYFYRMKKSMGKIKVAISVTNCICYDQRVLKMADVLAEMNADIIIIGRWKDKFCDEVTLPYRTVRFKMIFKKGFLFYKFYNIRLFFYLMFHRFDLIIANDLDTLLACYLASVIKCLPLVFDSHEYFTGLPEVINRPIVRSVWKLIEKICLPHLKYSITVNEPFARLYEDNYSIKPIVVRNCSRTAHHIKSYTKKELGVPESDFLIIIQGTGINVDMGVGELVNAMGTLKDSFLIVAGSGDMVPEMKKIVTELKLENKIKFIGPFPWDELIRYTKAADAGLIITRDTNLNYHYSLPNKLFDYIAAGIPIITSNLPLITDIITQYNCGIILPEITAEEIAEAINVLRNNRIMYSTLKENTLRASEELNWGKESEKVREFYENIFFKEVRIKKILSNT